MSNKQFPVLRQGSFEYTKSLDRLGCPRFVPWDFIASHHNACLRNHHQTPEELARRGGLGPEEMIAVIEATANWSLRCRAWGIKPDVSVPRLLALLEEWKQKAEK